MDLVPPLSPKTFQYNEPDKISHSDDFSRCYASALRGEGPACMHKSCHSRLDLTYFETTPGLLFTGTRLSCARVKKERCLDGIRRTGCALLSPGDGLLHVAGATEPGLDRERV